MIWRSWSEDRWSRLQSACFLQLVAHPGDYVAHLHTIFVAISTGAIRKVPEGEKMEGKIHVYLFQKSTLGKVVTPYCKANSLSWSMSTLAVATPCCLPTIHEIYSQIKQKFTLEWKQ